jgi:molecular chaperone GrpE
MTADAPHPEPTPAEPADAGNGHAAQYPQAPADAAEFGVDERLAALEARHAELNDAYLRSRAEIENVRRRAEEEVSKVRKFAVEAFAEALLPVRDSLEMAVGLPNATNEQLLEGVHATLRQLTHAMDRNKLLQINPDAGTKFDPRQHQAISMVPSDQEANTVVTVLQRGYVIADRVLRPALVTVAAPK